MVRTLRAYLLLPLLLASWVGTVAAMDDAVSFASGREWVRQMTPKEKLMSLLPPMALYHKFGVRFQRTVFEYIDTIDTVLAGNPVLQGEDMANIFASAVYALEPENRLPLERMGTVFGILRKQSPDNPYPSIPISKETILAE